MNLKVNRSLILDLLSLSDFMTCIFHPTIYYNQIKSMKNQFQNLFLGFKERSVVLDHSITMIYCTHILLYILRAFGQVTFSFGLIPPFDLVYPKCCRYHQHIFILHLFTKNCLIYVLELLNDVYR